MSEIDVKQAVKLAKDFAQSIYETEKISRLGLEAVERTEDGKFWLITLGFSRPWSYPKPKARSFVSPLDELLPQPKVEPQPEREYKVFKIDANSGELAGMDVFEE